MNGTQWGSLLFHMCWSPLCHYDECSRACSSVGGFHEETWHGKVLCCSLTRQSPLTQSNKPQTWSDPQLGTQWNTEITPHTQGNTPHTQHAWQYTRIYPIPYVYKLKHFLFASLFTSVRYSLWRENLGVLQGMSCTVPCQVLTRLYLAWFLFMFYSG